MEVSIDLDDYLGRVGKAVGHPVTFPKGYQWSETGVKKLVPNADNPDEFVRSLTVLLDKSKWQYGDLTNYGIKHYGLSVRQIVDRVGYTGDEFATPRVSPEDELKDYARVARLVEHPRRNPKLSFAHHREVANLHPLDQIDWLNYAEQNGLTASELRDGIKKAQRNSRGITYPIAR